MNPLMRCNYFTNLPADERSGGWSGMNVAIHAELAGRCNVRYVGPVNPPAPRVPRFLSRVQRLLGGRGAFAFFSDRRLRQIRDQVREHSDPAADFDFFHGQTPWAMCRPERPYFAYTDATFATYLATYHERSRFATSDLKRIFDAEAVWLAAAAGVFFSSAWAREQAIREYGLSGTKLVVAGVGGSLPMPAADTYAGGRSLLFVAHDFERKGGRLCLAAFRRVRAEHPDVTLSVVGARPPADVLAEAGVSYLGFLRKDVPDELARLTAAFAGAFALVHPTAADMTPLVVIEAAWHGCPAIAARRFGLPELVEPGVNGYLVPPPLDAGAIAAHLLHLCADDTAYRAMRAAARVRAVREFTWAAVGERIWASIQPAVRPV